MAKIVVGMSGGVDSSVAAAQLIAQGHHVTGLFMKNWEEDDDATYCAAATDLADAQAVCQTLGIELKTINFSHEYWQRVFQHFLAEYRAGRTPNPDVLCNKEIKFKEFLDWARALGADYIATGHYARRHHQQDYQLGRGQDRDKDQSYFLHTLDQRALRYAHFPLGEMQKSQVRATAKQLGLVTHAKKDSTGICFIGERRFRDFLQRYLPARTGELQTLTGTTLGHHQGAHFYTIGQRQGLGLGGAGDAWYVARKDMQKNVVVVVQGRAHPALHSRRVTARHLHWISGAPPPLPLTAHACTRYRQRAAPCVISQTAADTCIEFTTPQWAVTPGQAIVFYQDDLCLGGGVIWTAI